MPSQHSARLGKAGAKFGTVETESNTVTRPFQRGSQRPVSVLTTSAASQTVSDQARFLRFSKQLAASVKPQVRSDIAWAEEFFHPATAHGYTNAGSPKHDLGSRSIGHSNYLGSGLRAPSSRAHGCAQARLSAACNQLHSSHTFQQSKLHDLGLFAHS